MLAAFDDAETAGWEALEGRSAASESLLQDDDMAALLGQARRDRGPDTELNLFS
jgi:hypothetical protein